MKGKATKKASAKHGFDIPILFEDDNYIIFNKPAGLVVHADGRSTEPTLADWLIQNRPKMKDVGEPMTITSSASKSEAGSKATPKTETILRPGIVHRLDKETSGALVVAKNAAAFADLKEKFQQRQVEKKYHTFVYGNVKENDGTIDRPIGRSKSDFRMWSAQRGARGEMREAVTHYRVLGRGEAEGAETVATPVTFLEVQPKTGRTHQIRVHFKAIHHPVVADSLYASTQPQLLGFKRLALHARALSFKDLTGKKISVEAPYPEDFEQAVATI